MWDVWQFSVSAVTKTCLTKFDFYFPLQQVDRKTTKLHWWNKDPVKAIVYMPSVNVLVLELDLTGDGVLD